MDFIDTYKDVFGTRKFISMKKLTPGKIIQFTYDNEQKYALVLNPGWNGKMHALSLKSLTRESLSRLLKEIDLQTLTADSLYDTYKISEFTETRPYRTYTLEKISALREIYLKPKESED